MRAVLYLAQTNAANSRFGIKDIAIEIGSPELYLGKILQDLSRKGLIGSAKGPNGGFFMTPEMRSKPLIDIVKAVDGEDLFLNCGLGLKQCSELNPCPLHNQFKAIRANITAMLSEKTIDAFSGEMMDRMLNLKKTI